MADTETTTPAPATAGSPAPEPVAPAAATSSTGRLIAAAIIYGTLCAQHVGTTDAHFAGLAKRAVNAADALIAAL